PPPPIAETTFESRLRYRRPGSRCTSCADARRRRGRCLCDDAGGDECARRCRHERDGTAAGLHPPRPPISSAPPAATRGGMLFSRQEGELAMTSRHRTLVFAAVSAFVLLGGARMLAGPP